MLLAACCLLPALEILQGQWLWRSRGVTALSHSSPSQSSADPPLLSPTPPLSFGHVHYLCLFLPICRLLSAQRFPFYPIFLLLPSLIFCPVAASWSKLPHPTASPFALSAKTTSAKLRGISAWDPCQFGGFSAHTEVCSPEGSGLASLYSLGLLKPYMHFWYTS